MKRTAQLIRVIAGTTILTGTLYTFSCGQSTSTTQTKTMTTSTATIAPTLKPQSTCPVYGGTIDKKLFVDYNGKRIYVCCTSCISEIKKDPEKYINILKDRGEGVEVLPVIKPKTVTQAPKKAIPPQKPITPDTTKKMQSMHDMHHM